MTPLLKRKEIEQTRSLAEAVHLLFGLELEKRLCIFTDESMEGEVARAYNELGVYVRRETYTQIVEDFKIRTGCYGVNHPTTLFKVGSIVDIGCGSGLLTLELAEQTNSNKIIGLDISEDMVALAQSNLTRRSKERTKDIKSFWKRLPEICQPSQEDHTKLEKYPPFFDRIKYRKRSVYDLDKNGFQNINYMVCRNVLHRFQYPARALQQMYQILAPNGKIYLRDLRRDAAWPTVIKRIGEERWKHPVLVRDYIGAMAQMFTMDELRELLIGLGIDNFEITDGSYASNKKITSPQSMNEYASQVEYVCMIKKT